MILILYARLDSFNSSCKFLLHLLKCNIEHRSVQAWERISMSAVSIYAENFLYWEKDLCGGELECRSQHSISPECIFVQPKMHSLLGIMGAQLRVPLYPSVKYFRDVRVVWGYSKLGPPDAERHEFHVTGNSDLKLKEENKFETKTASVRRRAPLKKSFRAITS